MANAVVYALIIIAIIIILLAVFIMVTYNSLVELRNEVRKATSGLDVQLKRRFDLIPNLVETVKGYMAHEAETLTKITELRTSFNSAPTSENRVKINDELTGSVRKILAVAENYPDLKANINFLDLQNQLADTEDKISAERKIYNDVVLRYNNKTELFPSSIIASLFNFKKEVFFQIENETERQNVQVKF